MSHYLTFDSMLDALNPKEFSDEVRRHIAEHSQATELAVQRNLARLTNRQLAKRLRWKVSEVDWIESQSNSVMPIKRYKQYLEECKRAKNERS